MKLRVSNKARRAPRKPPRRTGPGLDKTPEQRWREARRREWLRTGRMQLPPGARKFDGITDEAISFMRVGVYHEPFGPGSEAEAQARLAADRAAVKAFRERDPEGAAEVWDVMALWLADLDQVGRAVQVMADGGGGRGDAFVEAHGIIRGDDTTFGRRLRR